MRERLKRVAVAGNVCALVVLVLLCANADVLFGPGRAGWGQGTIRTDPLSTLRPPPLTGPPARGAVLIVIDGLRVDTARNAEVMPCVAELAARGGSGTARVDAMVPSTIAGIVALAGGQVLPPGSFLNDFRGRPADDGGVFAAVAGAGGRSFVAGPRLWTDVYGRWVHASRTLDTFVGDEGPLVDAAVGAVRSGEYRLVVLHLGRTDEAAHRAGGTSAEYAQAARWCDDAVRRVARALDPQTCLIVTSDHGVTDAGGHAGPERVVLDTPLVTFGPGLPVGRFGPLRQRDVPGLILRAVAIGAGSPVAPRAAVRSGPRLLLVCASALAAVSCAVRVWASLCGPVVGGRYVLLCSTFWIALPLLLVGRGGWALLIALAALATGVRLAPGTAGMARRLAVILGAAIVFGVIRTSDAFFIDGGHAGNVTSTGILSVVGLLGVGGGTVLLGRAAYVSARHRRGAGDGGRLPGRWVVLIVAGTGLSCAAGGLPLAVLFTGAVCTGAVVGAAMFPRGPAETIADGSGGDAVGVTHSSRAATAGAVMSVAHVPLSWLAGQTCSLSTIDVRAAYDVIHLPGGLGLAVAAVIVAQSVLPLGLLIGLAPRLRRLSPAGVGAFASGIAAGIVGQAAAAAAVLAGSGGHGTVAALALGCLLRTLGETSYLFLAAALAVVVAPARSQGTAGSALAPH